MKYYVAQRDTKSKGLLDIISVVGSKIWRHNVFSLTESPELRYRDVTDRQRRIADTRHWAASVWLSHGPSGGARPGNVGMPKVPRFSRFQPSRCVGRPPGHEYAEDLRQ